MSVVVTFSLFFDERFFLILCSFYIVTSSHDAMSIINAYVHVHPILYK